MCFKTYRRNKRLAYDHKYSEICKDLILSTFLLLRCAYRCDSLALGLNLFSFPPLEFIPKQRPNSFKSNFLIAKICLFLSFA